MRRLCLLSLFALTLPLAEASGGNDEAPLFRPQNPPLPTASGKVTLGQRHGGEQLAFHTSGFDVALGYHVILQDAQQVFQDVGTLDAPGGNSERGELAFDTSRGGTLPFSATLAELAGRRVEIRDGSSHVVLFGALPSMGGSRATVNENARLRTTSEGRDVKARGRIRTQFKPSKMRYRLDIRVWATTQESSLSLWIENPATNLLEQIDTAIWNGGATKRAFFRWRGDRSERLPFGIVDPTQLDGMRVEVRNESDQALLTGRL